MKHMINSRLSLILSDIKKYSAMILVITVVLILEFCLFHRICPVAVLTGLPCPGCGITRACAALLTLHFTDAFLLNPCVYIWVPFILYLLVNRYILMHKVKHLNMLCILVGLISIGVYIVRMLTMYPDTYPMQYNYNCILQRVIHFFL